MFIQVLLALSLALKAGFVVLLVVVIISRGLAYLGSQFRKLPPKNTYLTSYYEQKVSLFEVLPLPCKNKLVFLGDSLTEQGEWSELFNKPDILNRGISGDTTDGLLRRIDQVIASKPSTIFLMIGINDILNEKKPASIIAENYTKILNKIKSLDPKITVIVQSILPINANLFPRRVDTTVIVSLNSQLQELAQEFFFPYLDLYSKFSNEQDQLDSKYTLDGVHLTGQGYLLWKEVIEEWSDSKTM